VSLIARIEPIFVEFIPPERDLVLGKLYISKKYETTVHLCADGCGRKVVLPLTPGRWSLREKGDEVSLSPSVGNWDLPCRSHYLICDSRIVSARPWDDERIAQGRERDQRDVDRAFGEPEKKLKSFWDWLFGR
jgi:hypothetical protein